MDVMDLYHSRVLELAAGIADPGRLTAPDGSATKVSRVCGSTVTVDIALEGERITAIGLEAQACALGQASAAIFAAHAIGAYAAEVRRARDALAAMLRAGGPPPDGRFWELRHLEAVRDYPPRHASTMLAFEAAVAAIEQATAKAPSRA
jgi:NifU-like protein involved in Fe-S cluster formation